MGGGCDGLAEVTVYVVPCLLIGGIAENLGCFIKLNKTSHKEESGLIRYTCGLLHVVRHDDDAQAFAQFNNAFF